MFTADFALATVQIVESLPRLIVRRLRSAGEVMRLQWHGDRGGAEGRHCFLDDLLPEDLALRIYKSFPANAEGFTRTDDFRDRESVSPHLDRLPPPIGEAMFAFHHHAVIEAVEAITGIPALEPDPLLYAGGVSMMFRGDYLNPHIDNSHDADRQRYRRVNLLYYVTPDWRAEHGGHLELWDRRVSGPRTIMSQFNRLVLMETTSRSWHSVSPVIAAGPRCALRNFYFTSRSPTGADYYHVTSFTGRPGQHARRAFGLVDNALRNFARAKLRLRRYRDRVYKGGRR